MKIVRMTAGHIGGVRRLLCEVFSDPWSEQNIRSELERADALCLVADDAGEVVGYLAFEKILDEGTVAELAVSPRFRRRGIARAMLEQAAESFPELRTITLEVRASNIPAISLYESLGFIRIAVRKLYYSAPAEDALIMTNYLGDKNEDTCD